MADQKELEKKGYDYLRLIVGKIKKPVSKLVGKLSTMENRLHFKSYLVDFGERDEDIYISTYPKSGTTLTQVIVYSLVTNGNLDFNHIYDVSPWIRNSSFKRMDPVELPNPRIIKTHDKYSDFPKGVKGKFIYVHRDGMDVAVSLYNQQKDYNYPNLVFSNFLKKHLKSNSWFKHTQAWLKNKNKHNILYIKYEDLVKNKRQEVDRIIEFLGLDCSEETIEKALHQSSFEFMKANEDKFGDRPEPKLTKEYNQFIRKGKSGEGKNSFSKEEEEIFTKKYKKFVKSIESKVFKK